MKKNGHPHCWMILLVSDDTGLDETEESEQEHESNLDIEPWTDDTKSEDEED